MVRLNYEFYLFAPNKGTTQSRIHRERTIKKMNLASADFQFRRSRKKLIKVRKVLRRQRGTMVWWWDLKSGVREFKSRADPHVKLVQLMSGSTPRMRLYIADWSGSCWLGFLTCTVLLLSEYQPARSLTQRNETRNTSSRICHWQDSLFTHLSIVFIHSQPAVTYEVRSLISLQVNHHNPTQKPRAASVIVPYTDELNCS